MVTIETEMLDSFNTDCNGLKDAILVHGGGRLPSYLLTLKRFANETLHIGKIDQDLQEYNTQQAQRPKTLRPITVHSKKSLSSSPVEVGMWYLL